MFPPLPNARTQPERPRLNDRDILRRSASKVEPPQERLPQVAKLIDVSKCIGCKSCQVACSQWNELEHAVGENVGEYENPLDLSAEAWTIMRYTEWDNPKTGNLEWLIRKEGCMHCEDPGCLKACPSPGAIVQFSNGVVDFISEHCIGCGYCVKGCPFNVPRVSPVTHKAHKCSLCVDRIAADQGPACAKSCPTQAIAFGTKEQMIEHADQRIADLKSRGFENAGLYNPAGVGGTHVMYVLHHADQPELYAGLPRDPKISKIVNFWKGPIKLFGLAAFAATAVASAIHYFLVGPDVVEPDEEKAAEALIEDAGK